MLLKFTDATNLKLSYELCGHKHAGRETLLHTIQDMQNLKGNNVEVTMIEVDPSFKKIVLSMARAQQCKQLKAIHLGALMWGEVRRIEEFGAFIGLDGTRISGLLHISNISRARVETVAVSSACIAVCKASVKVCRVRSAGFGLGGTRISGLLPISNMIRARASVF